MNFRPCMCVRVMAGSQRHRPDESNMLLCWFLPYFCRYFVLLFPLQWVSLGFALLFSSINVLFNRIILRDAIWLLLLRLECIHHVAEHQRNFEIFLTKHTYAFTGCRHWTGWIDCFERCSVRGRRGNSRFSIEHRLVCYRCFRSWFRHHLNVVRSARCCYSQQPVWSFNWKSILTQNWSERKENENAKFDSFFGW